MKCIVIVVGLLAILALVQAQDDAVDAPSSESNSEEAEGSTEEPQEDEHEHPPPHPPHQHHHHHHEEGNPDGQPPKRIPVFGFGITFNSGK